VKLRLFWFHWFNHKYHDDSYLNSGDRSNSSIRIPFVMGWLDNSYKGVNVQYMIWYFNQCLLLLTRVVQYMIWYFYQCLLLLNRVVQYMIWYFYQCLLLLNRVEGWLSCGIWSFPLSWLSAREWWFRFGFIPDGALLEGMWTFVIFKNK